MGCIYIPDRKILLPRELDKKLKELAKLNQETSGVLLYETQRVDSGLHLSVGILYMTDRGERIGVGIDPDRKAIVDDFLGLHQNYKYIECHTHVTGNRGLSETDRKHYAKELSYDPYFIAMIITPSERTTIKSKNSGDLKTYFVTNSDEYYTRKNDLQRELEESAKRLGFGGLPTLRATRTRRI